MQFVNLSNIIGAGQDTARRAPKTMPEILDVCCGGRAMWFDRSNKRAIYCDRRNETVVFYSSQGDREHHIKPDVMCNFVNLPFKKDLFKVVIFDPPHVQRDQPLGNVTKRYGVLNGNWRMMLCDGFAECFRVLQPGGILVFKWSSVQFSVDEILELTPEVPLFGHQSGLRMNTHWICFMKEDRTSCAQDSPAQDTMEGLQTAYNRPSMPALQVALEL